MSSRPWREERARQASRAVLPGLEPDAVTNLSLTLWGQQMIQVERVATNPGDWRLTQPISYPGNAAPIEGLVKALAQLQWQDRVAASELLHRPDAAGQYGFDQPQGAIELQDHNGARRLEIGKTSALGDQLFVKVVGSYVGLGS